MSGYEDSSRETERLDRSGNGAVSRREFLKLAGLTGAVVGFGGGLGAVLSACGGGEATTTTTAAPVTTTTAAAVTTTAGAATTATTVATTTTSAAAAMGDKAVFAVEDFGRDIPYSWLNGPRDVRPWLQVFDPLIQVSNAAPADYKPGLFTEWSHSDDYKTWTFKVRQGVMFHEDYGELTSADIKWFFEQTLRPDAQGFGNPWYQQTIASVDTPDKYTVVLNCKRSAVEALDQLTWLLTGPTITSKAYMEKVGEEAALAHAIGTGPYHFVSGTPASNYLFEALPSHWRVTPSFKQIEFQAVADEATRVAGLQSGQFDVIMATGDSLKQVQSAGLNVVDFPGIMTYFVNLPGQTTPKYKCYNPDFPWVGQPDAASQEKALKVRKALNLAVNKQAIIDAFWQGHGAQTPFSYFYYPGDPGYSDQWVVPPYDPEQAKQLLADAGYANGFEIPVMLVNQAPDGPVIMEAVAQDWEKVGLKVTRANVGMMDLNPQIGTGTWKQCWVFAYPMVIGNATVGIHDNIFCGPEGNLFIRNDQVEADITTAMNELDEAKRTQMTSAIGQQLYDAFYGVMIGIKSMTYATNARIGGWNPPTPEMYEPFAEYLQWSGK
jgi:peptide/nickel transport system substrate-binding protein